MDEFEKEKNTMDLDSPLSVEDLQILTTLDGTNNILPELGPEFENLNVERRPKETDVTNTKGSSISASEKRNRRKKKHGKDQNVEFIENVKSCFEVERKSLLEEINRLQRRLTSVNPMSGSFNSRLDISSTYQYEDFSFDVEVRKREKKYRNLHKQVKSVDVHSEIVARNQIEKLQKELKSIMRQSEKQKDRANVSEKLLDDASYELKRSQIENHNLILAAEKERQNYQLQLESTRKKLNDLQSANAKYEEENKRTLTVLSEDMCKIRFDRDTWRQKYVALETQLKDINGQLDNRTRKWDKRSNEFRDQLDRMKRNSIQSEREYKRIQSELDDERKKVHNERHRADSLSTDLMLMHTQLIDQEKAMERQKAENHKLRDQLEQTQVEREESKQMVEVMRLRCAIVEREKGRFEENMNSLEIVNEKIRGNSDNNFAKIANLRSQAEMLQKKLSATMDETLQLEKENASLVVKLNEAQYLQQSSSVKLLKTSEHNNMLETKIKQIQESHVQLEQEAKTYKKESLQAQEKENLMRKEARAARSTSEINREKANSALKEALEKSCETEKFKKAMLTSTEQLFQLQARYKESCEAGKLMQEELISFKHNGSLLLQEKLTELAETRKMLENMKKLEVRVKSLTAEKEVLEQKERVANIRCVRLQEKLITLNQENNKIDKSKLKLESLHTTNINDASEVEEIKKQTISNLQTIIESKNEYLKMKDNDLCSLKAKYQVLLSRVREQALTIHQLSITEP
uniref:Uncharacterized protein n=1 Tax=Aplanochytrium stocchinoi TaxID=215587 RepID=A0A7S3LMM5_9STRA